MFKVTLIRLKTAADHLTMFTCLIGVPLQNPLNFLKCWSCKEVNSPHLCSLYPGWQFEAFRLLLIWYTHICILNCRHSVPLWVMQVKNAERRMREIQCYQNLWKNQYYKAFRSVLKWHFTKIVVSTQMWRELVFQLCFLAVSCDFNLDVGCFPSNCTPV